MINQEELKKIAVLSRLELNEEELISFENDLNKALDYIDKLNELDTNSVEPTYCTPINVEDLREDVIKPSMDRELLLQNAPEQEDGAFKVPTVVE